MAQRLATPDDLTALAPEFKDQDCAFLQILLDSTAAQIPLGVWMSKASTAHAYLTAHILTVAEGGERGQVNARSIDKVSVSYAAVGTATQLDANLSTTKWGRLFLQLRSTLLNVPIVGRRSLLVP
jgi:hypothetical protein